MSNTADDHLQELLGYLKQDPDNEMLLGDVVEAALAAGQTDIARRQLAKRALRGPLPPELANLSGLVAMRAGDPSEARSTFAALMEDHGEDPGIAFNYAWASAVDGDPDAALDVLTETVTAALADAAALEIQLRHSQGDFEGAHALARDHLSRHPDHRALNAAASVLALDVHDLALARSASAKGGDHPDALTTQALLELGEGNTEQAKAAFDQVLDRREHSPRARVGRGLAALTTGDHTQATRDLDRGAEMFGTHLGSWIAAGWAHLVAGDIQTAKARFQHVIELDENFAEGHGAMAVVSILGGDPETGQRYGEVARRLDRKSFSAALAQTLIQAGQGEPDKAREIVERAMNTPIDGTSETLATAMVRFGVGLGAEADVDHANLH